MSTGTIGLYIRATDARERLTEIEKAESLGIPAVWLNLARAHADSLTIIAAAAARTERLLFGTCVVPIWSRHPVAIAQQVQAIEAVAPGRMRLGLGPGHRGGMTSQFGVEWAAPQGHLREYVTIVKQLLHEGSVDFAGRYYRATANIDTPTGTPVMTSALRERGFKLAGEIADGVIPWVSPLDYLRDVALPNVESGAIGAGREAPPVIAYASVSVHENADEVRRAAREQMAVYTTLPNYLSMFADQGFAESEGEEMSDALVDAVVFHGDEARVAGQLQELLDTGVEEVFVRPVAAGDRPDVCVDRTLRLLASLAG